MYQLLVTGGRCGVIVPDGMLFGMSNAHAESKTARVGQSVSSSNKFTLLAVAPEYYVSDNLSVGVELGLLAVEESEPGQFLIGNLTYTYRISGSDFALFARAGYG
jgi:hypothetical protein